MDFMLVKCTMAWSLTIGLLVIGHCSRTITRITSNIVTIIQVRLGWSAPGGDWTQGRAAAYNLTCTGTEAEAEVVVECEETPAPAHYGDTQTCSLALAGTMEDGGELRCSLRAVNTAGNW